jgi:hypothetical protein
VSMRKAVEHEWPNVLLFFSSFLNFLVSVLGVERAMGVHYSVNYEFFFF